MCSVVIMTGICFLSLWTRRLQIFNSMQPKLSAFDVDYIVATLMEISHDLVTK